MSWAEDDGRYDGCHIGNGRTVRTTDKAILVELDNHKGRKLWIPKSVVHDDSEVYGSEHEGKVIVMRWWADEEGLDAV